MPSYHSSEDDQDDTQLVHAGASNTAAASIPTSTNPAVLRFGGVLSYCTTFAEALTLIQALPNDDARTSASHDFLAVADVWSTSVLGGGFQMLETLRDSFDDTDNYNALNIKEDY